MGEGRGNTQRDPLASSRPLALSAAFVLTSAPRPQTSSTTARPIPLVPPVTRTRMPWRPKRRSANAAAAAAAVDDDAASAAAAVSAIFLSASASVCNRSIGRSSAERSCGMDGECDRQLRRGGGGRGRGERKFGAGLITHSLTRLMEGEIESTKPLDGLGPLHLLFPEGQREGIDSLCFGSEIESEDSEIARRRSGRTEHDVAAAGSFLSCRSTPGHSTPRISASAGI